MHFILDGMCAFIDILKIFTSAYVIFELCEAFILNSPVHIYITLFLWNSSKFPITKGSSL